MTLPRFKTLGISLITTTWSIYALMSTLAKQTYAFAPPMVAFFFQNFVALLLITPFLLRREGGWRAFQSKKGFLLFWRGVGGAASFYCFFHSLGRLPLTDCTVLNCTSPLFVPFILLAIWKRTISWQLWGSVLLGFSGILLVFPPQSQGFNESTFIGLMGGLGTALTMFLIRSLSDEPYQRVMFYYFLIASASSFPFALSHIPNLPAEAVLLYVLIGLLFMLAQACYTLSFRYACPSILAPFTYVFILASILIECVAWQKFPALSHCAGIALVIAGGGMIVMKMRTERDSNP